MNAKTIEMMMLNRKMLVWKVIWSVWLIIFATMQATVVAVPCSMTSAFRSAAASELQTLYQFETDPLGLVSDQYQNLLNDVQAVANAGAYLGRLSADPCEQQRARAALLAALMNPNTYADAVFGIDSALAAGFFGPEATAAETIATPYGAAVQSSAPEALSALEQVQNGATVYKGGVLGSSVTGDSQFLALENPLNPGYAGRYGIPPQNANFNFVLTGQVQPGASVITRVAPGIPPNPGGAIEAVTTPGAFQINSFHMP